MAGSVCNAPLYEPGCRELHAFRRTEPCPILPLTRARTPSYPVTLDNKFFQDLMWGTKSFSDHARLRAACITRNESISHSIGAVANNNMGAFEQRRRPRSCRHTQTRPLRRILYTRHLYTLMTDVRHIQSLCCTAIARLPRAFQATGCFAAAPWLPKKAFGNTMRHMHAHVGT